MMQNIEFIKTIIKENNYTKMQEVYKGQNEFYNILEMKKLRSMYIHSRKNNDHVSNLSTLYLKWLKKLEKSIKSHESQRKELNENTKNVKETEDHFTIISEKAMLNSCKKCDNCKRAQVDHMLYRLDFQYYRTNEVIRRRKFCYIQKNKKRILLCGECSEYLTNTNGKTYKNMWPSFLWYSISNSDLKAIYQLDVWKFIPTSWRRWWKFSIEEDLSILPKSVFIDQTNRHHCFQSEIQTGILSKIANACNEYLIPTVLCPWGCTEYIHKVGVIPLDIVFQRYMPKFRFSLISCIDSCEKVFSSRDDYIRKDSKSYECLLLNPNWNVLPGVLLCRHKGGVVLTCCNHSGGTKKKYIHIPRYPFNHNLPSKHGDQLCHVVIKPRSISSKKASKYSNTYQMHEQRGCYQGIDTCSLTTYHDFSYWSHLLHQSECLSISNRSDIVSLLHKLERKSMLCNIEKMKEVSTVLLKNMDVKKYLDGATYMSLDDSISLQRKVSRDIKIPIIDATGNILYCKRNWIENIIYAQKCNKDGYGAQFPIVPKFGSSVCSTKILWILVSLLSSVKELWCILDNKKKRQLNGMVG